MTSLLRTAALLVFAYLAASARADDLAALSDEFDSPATLAHWQRNDTAEGWHADKLEQWDIAATTPGHMRLMPYSSSWYMNFTGAYAFKEITGDFVVTTRLTVTNRAGTGRPDSDYSLTGLMIRAPRAITHAAPAPDPGPATVLPWPPPAAYQPNHYTTDWRPHTENYIFLSHGFGSAGFTRPDGANPARWHYEVKTTINGVSTLYPRTHGVPENEPEATLQIVRRGATFLLLRRHGDGPWIIENRFERPDLPATLQVGLTTYTDWNTVAAGWDYQPTSLAQPYHQNRIVNVGFGTPDLIADVDYFRLRRPAPAIDQAALQTVPVTGSEAPSGLVLLSSTALAAHLGDTAAPSGLAYSEWLTTQLSADQLADPALTDPYATLPGNPLPNILHYLLGPPGSAGFPPALSLDPAAPATALRYLVPRQPAARGWRLVVETSTDLATWTELAASANGAAPTGPGLVTELPGPPLFMVVAPDPADPDANAPRRFYRTRAQPLPLD
jgi:hypothetical protein